MSGRLLVELSRVNSGASKRWSKLHVKHTSHSCVELFAHGQVTLCLNQLSHKQDVFAQVTMCHKLVGQEL